VAITGAATTSATSSAGLPAVNSGDLVNVAVGYPAQERWPGPVDPGQYTDAGPDYLIEGPPSGGWVLDDWAGNVPEQIQGGGVQDTSWMTGTDGPQLPWDSAAGAPFAPSGAVNPDLHSTDTGAVFAAQHVVPADIGQVVRHSPAGQTWNREYAFDPVTGGNVPALNGRANYDQMQVTDPAPGDGGGWAPWDPGYAERPVYNNLAYTATEVTSEPVYTGVAGQLPDRSPWQAYSAEFYEAPASPAIAPSPAAAAGGTSDGWLIG
jgi:hypothetical protein